MARHQLCIIIIIIIIIITIFIIIIIIIKSKKNYRFEKKEYIDSTAQKKSNKITKLLINAFLWVSKPLSIKMHWSRI